jgi:hypothetical protein
MDILPKEIRNITSHHSSRHPRQPVEFLRFTAVDFGIRISCIRIRITLPTFGHCVRVTGVNTGARIAAISIQTLEWHCVSNCDL